MILAWLFIGLAGWRLASLATQEDGPFDIFEYIRHFFQPEGKITNPIGKMLLCIWCTSVWTCSFMALLWFFVNQEVVMVAAAMAIAPIINNWVQPEH